jgi:hypothetical protein
VFLVAELHGRHPMLDLALFRRPAMTGVSISGFALSASILSLFLYLTLYIQDDLGFRPLAAGLRFLPITLLSFLVSPVAGRLTVKIQARYLIGVGLVLVSLGLLLMGTTQPDSSWTQLLPGFMVVGIGIGMVPPRQSGMASGINSTFRQVGIATGIAGLGAVFQSQMAHRTVSTLSSTSAGQAVLAHGGSQLGTALTAGQVHAVAGSPGLTAAGRAALLHAYRVSFSGTINDLLTIGAVVAAVGALLTFALVRQRDFVVTGVAGATSPDGQEHERLGVQSGVAVGAEPA